MEFIHTCLNVADADRAVEWYTEQLGLKESWSFETADGRTVNRYVTDDNGFELQLSDTEGETALEEGTLWDHVALGVDDVDAAFDRIDNHGVVQPPQDNNAAGARTAFIKDPDGHVVELVEPLED
ncbi:MAG: VOC family protein [Halobacteriales archaeon]|nr:VOC family protein [Halobacteriales archaeon]